MESLLMKMKAEIDDNKSKKSRLEGELDGVLAQLKSQFGFSSVEEAEDHLDKLKESLPGMEQKLAKEIDTLKSAYPWKTI